MEACEADGTHRLCLALAGRDPGVFGSRALAMPAEAAATPAAAAREAADCEGLLMLLEGRLSICR